MSDTSQTELVQRARSGDKDAFGRLMKENAERVRRLVSRVVRRRADTEDVVQMVFFEAYRSLPTFDGRALFAQKEIKVTLCGCGG